MFQTALNSRLSTNTFSPKPPLPLLRHGGSLHPVALPSAKLRLRPMVVKALSDATEVENGSVSHLERCFATPSGPATGDSPSSPSGLGPVMKGQYGSLGSVTLEKSKLDTSQKQTQSSPEVCLILLLLLPLSLSLFKLLLWKLGFIMLIVGLLN